MKRTKRALIVTADDFPIGSVVSSECDALVQKLKTGKHLYGGPIYPGHHVVFKFRDLRHVPVNPDTAAAMAFLSP